jgi:hypothetical protein
VGPCGSLLFIFLSHCSASSDPFIYAVAAKLSARGLPALTSLEQYLDYIPANMRAATATRESGNIQINLA